MARWFLILLSGCSLTLSGPDPNRPRNNRPACDTSKGLVALDGVMAATLGLTAIGLATGNDSGTAVAPALIGSLFLLSAIHGNSTVDACNREMASFANSVAPPLSDEQVAQLPAPVVQPPAMQPPVVQPPMVQQPVVQPQPAVVMPAPPPQAAPAPQRPQPPVQRAGEDPWAAFWQEVP